MNSSQVFSNICHFQSLEFYLYRQHLGCYLIQKSHWKQGDCSSPGIFELCFQEPWNLVNRSLWRVRYFHASVVALLLRSPMWRIYLLWVPCPDLLLRPQWLTCFSLQKEDDKPFKVPISEDSFETYQLDPPPYSLETTKSQLKQLYYDMTLIRLVRTSGSVWSWC